jgi:hypothetical protein
MRLEWSAEAHIHESALGVSGWWVVGAIRD